MFVSLCYLAAVVLYNYAAQVRVAVPVPLTALPVALVVAGVLCD